MGIASNPIVAQQAAVPQPHYPDHHYSTPGQYVVVCSCGQVRRGYTESETWALWQRHAQVSQ